MPHSIHEVLTFAHWQICFNSKHAIKNRRANQDCIHIRLKSFTKYKIQKLTAWNRSAQLQPRTFCCLQNETEEPLTHHPVWHVEGWGTCTVVPLLHGKRFVKLRFAATTGRRFWFGSTTKMWCICASEDAGPQGPSYTELTVAEIPLHHSICSSQVVHKTFSSRRGCGLFLLEILDQTNTVPLVEAVHFDWCLVQIDCRLLIRQPHW